MKNDRLINVSEDISKYTPKRENFCWYVTAYKWYNYKCNYKNYWGTILQKSLMVILFNLNILLQYC